MTNAAVNVIYIILSIETYFKPMIWLGEVQDCGISIAQTLIWLQS